MTEKKTYSLPIGPQHPMYVEAENLTVHVDGETIIDVDVNIGYLHRGIEELMQRRNYMQNVYLAERICGICSGVHSMTYCQAVENLLQMEIPERAKYIRTIVLELERLHSHLLFLGIAGYEMGLDTVFMYAWRDREYVMDMLEQISGNRVNYAMPVIGGSRRDIANTKIPGFLKKLDYLDKRSDYYANLFLKDKTILARTKTLGILKQSNVENYSIVGPVARASNVRIDIRKDMPYLAYDSLDWEIVSQPGCDVQARVLVKVYEMKQSIEILNQCMKQLIKTKGDFVLKNVPLNIPENESIALYEAPRGELVYYLRSNGSDKPARARVRTPSFVNILHSLKPMLREQQLADLPIIVASIDPCFSCTDRITLIDINSGDKKCVDEAYIKKLGERK